MCTFRLKEHARAAADRVDGLHDLLRACGAKDLRPLRRLAVASSGWGTGGGLTFYEGRPSSLGFSRGNHIWKPRADTPFVFFFFFIIFFFKRETPWKPKEYISYTVFFSAASRR